MESEVKEFIENEHRTLKENITKVKVNILSFINVNELDKETTADLTKKLNENNFIKEIVTDGLVSIVHMPEMANYIEFHTSLNNRYSILYDSKKKSIRVSKNTKVLK